MAADAREAAQVTLTIDSVAHVELLAGLDRPHGLRVALDVDASLRIGGLHLGVRRSPLREPAEVVEVARAASAAGLHVVGLMFYDAQIAGLPGLLARGADHEEALGAVAARTPRGSVVAAVREVAELEFVNGGGTGSLHVTGQDPAVTELAAGSGLYGPSLFDGYDDFSPSPAAAFALPVVRRPGRDFVTAFGGGYVASGPPGWSRVPSPLAARVSSWSSPRGSARCRLRCRARGFVICSWETGCGSATPRRGRCASGSTPSTS